jgi:hypothetical protein
MSALFNFDIATGNISTTEHSDYASSGPAEVYNITNEGITDPGSQCYVLDKDQCTAEQWQSVEDGTALVRNWIVVDANTTSLFPDLANGTGNGTSNGTSNGTAPSGTGTPTPSAGPSPTESSGGAPPSSAAAVSGRRTGHYLKVWGLEIGVVGSVVLAMGLGSLMVML